MSLQSGRVYLLPLDFAGISISYLDGTVFPLTEQARQISAKFT